jgi:hypothetical protein
MCRGNPIWMPVEVCTVSYSGAEIVHSLGVTTSSINRLAFFMRDQI